MTAFHIDATMKNNINTKLTDIGKIYIWNVIINLLLQINAYWLSSN